MATKISNIVIFKNLLEMQSKVIERLLCDVEILRKELKSYEEHEEYDCEEKTEVIMPDPIKNLRE